MTKRIKLTNARREVIQEFGHRHIANGIDRAEERRHLTVLIDGANAAIRARYPDADMAVLRKYDLEGADRSRKFLFPGGRVDGLTFPCDANLAAVPQRRHYAYGGDDVFPVTAAFEVAFDEYAKLKDESDRSRCAKEREFSAFLTACRYLDEVLDVIPLPDDVRARVGQDSTALVAVTAETVESLKATFETAA